MARHKRSYSMPIGALSDHPWLQHAVKNIQQRKQRMPHNHSSKDRMNLVYVVSTDNMQNPNVVPIEEALTPLQLKEHKERLAFEHASTQSFRSSSCNETEINLRDSIETLREQCAKRVLRDLLKDGWQVEAALAEAREVTSQQFRNVDRVMRIFDSHFLAPKEALGVLKNVQKRLNKIRVEEEKIAVAETRCAGGIQR